MKKSIYTLSMLALGGMLALAGCGNGNNGGKADNSASGTANAGAEGAGAAGGLKPYKITLVYPGSAPKDLQMVQDAMSKYLTEKINATIELKPIEWGSWDDKTNLMKLSNEPFDLMFTASWFNYAKDVSKGQFLPLEELMAKNGKDIQGVLGDDFINGAKISGKLYGLPTHKEFAQGFGLVLDKKLVDKYHFNTDGIKTLDDLETMFDTVKKNEPGVTPIVSLKLSSIWSAANSDSLVTGLGIPRGSTELKAVDSLGQEPSEFDKKMDKWVKAGYFDKDYLTSDADQGLNLIKAGKAFSVAQSLKPGKDKELSVTSGVDLVQVEIAKPFTVTGDAQGAMLAISRTSKDPDRAMMFLNMLYTDKELLNMLVWGIEGVHYVKKSDNIIGYPDGVTAETTGYPNPGGWMFGDQFKDYLWDNEDPQKWAKFEEFNKSADHSIALGFTFDQEPVKAELASIANVDKEFQPLLNGATLENRPKIIEKYRKKRDAAGFARVKEELQRQLDEWAKTRK
ncbi:MULTISPECIES: ABC transporter substrate-binding protein [unclassified Paenibacillus]|uniref:ABC transporter substrate-binding protein n=1 Tax=Paenibacillus TaxID=44249 RepID=UPI000400F1ED|nr:MULTISPECIES: ABC transporter substrate-binding protein [unclassified Paenibacillus]KKC49246.1 ABC transporter substrate-binding protein [Paenibacillus sp. D9]